ncbi:Beta-galactosidase 9 [Capsicum chinense]|nr:Beta-galactosidase 9 [Capsicum chinense]
MESEFIALNKAGEEEEWLRNFLEDIPYWPKPVAPICIHCDSQAAIGRTWSIMYNGKFRHIRRRHNTVRVLLSSGIITVDYVKSKDNVSDSLTKGLSREGVQRTFKGMGLKPRTSQHGGASLCLLQFLVVFISPKSDIKWIVLLVEQTKFDAPGRTDPVALDFSSMGKGQAWVNGHHIGRYWTLVAPNNGCERTCDYRGAYGSDKCRTNCGEITQAWYHIPRSWLNTSNNVLVIFEETDRTPFEISISTRSTETICAQVSEKHYPPLHTWSHSEFDGKISLTDKAPEMHLQCDEGHTISSIEFASYGDPNGSCQTFSQGKCHAANSLSVVSQACKGRNSCSIGISNAVVGDPCRHIVKSLAVQAKCSPPPDLSISAFA